MRRAEMSYEIECPVCDRKAQVSTSICPYCGADLTMASFDELEEVAQSIATGKGSGPLMEPKAVSRPLETKSEPTVPEPSEPKTETHEVKEPKPSVTPTDNEVKEPEIPDETKSVEEGKKEEEGKKGLGRLFGRKKK